MQRLNTGDNPALTRDLLAHVSHDLERNRGCKIHGPVQDSQGTFALHVSQGNQHAFVVGRNTKPFKTFIIGIDGKPKEVEVVSTQQTLINLALHGNCPIIMNMPGNEYLMFDPRRIMMESFGIEHTNERLDEVMVNFNVDHGRPWLPSETLSTVWLNCQGDTSHVKKARQTLLTEVMEK